MERWLGLAWFLSARHRFSSSVSNSSPQGCRYIGPHNSWRNLIRSTSVFLIYVPCLLGDMQKGGFFSIYSPLPDQLNYTKSLCVSDATVRDLWLFSGSGMFIIRYYCHKWVSLFYFFTPFNFAAIKPFVSVVNPVKQVTPLKISVFVRKCMGQISVSKYTIPHLLRFQWCYIFIHLRNSIEGDQIFVLRIWLNCSAMHYQINNVQ